MTLSYLHDALREKVQHRVWVCSDLQQWDPEIAKTNLEIIFADFHSLKAPCEQVWNLGDSTDGRHLENQRRTITLQAEAFESLEIPIYYTFGNHDFDLLKKSPEEGSAMVPAWEILKPRPAWHLPEKLDDFYFEGELGGFKIYFMGDHACPWGKWIVTHGKIHGDESQYPHSSAAYQSLRSEWAESSDPILIAGHYSFPGGNRPSPLLQNCLPLPDPVKAVFYGHAHLGEERLLQENNFRKIAYANYQSIPQFDIAAMENRKGTFLRSALVEIYEDQSVGVFFRNHEHRRWEEALVLDSNRKS
ncbi:MAG: metallophosphoesterase [Opitutales bacterium]|nr:metallophosphoesterase [Opitutales bacterium]MCH8539864.1 metallophosphoesterase [Opitutales bacterium]